MSKKSNEEMRELKRKSIKMIKDMENKEVIRFIYNILKREYIK